MQTQSEIQRHLDDAADNLKRVRLRNMQLAAGGLLVIALALFVLAHAMAGRHPAWGYVAAFAEASMIGAMADWFAIVALFRHPLGIPVWHTAIIPNSKDEIGRNLGEFVENHFITEEGIAKRIRQSDLAAKIGKWLHNPGNTEKVGHSAAKALKKIINALNHEEIGIALRDVVTQQLAQINIAGSAGAVMDMLVEERKHQELLDAMLDGIDTYLSDEEHHPMIAQFLISAFDIENRLAKKALTSYAPKAIASLNATVSAIRTDPTHVFRLRFNDWIAEFVLHLKADPEWSHAIGRYQRETLANPQVQSLLSGLWSAVKGRLQDDLSKDDPAIARTVQVLMQKFGQILVDDPTFRNWLNAAIEAGSTGLVRQYRGEVGKFIEHQLGQWTKEKMADRIELAIGRDLQFIRINGTLVGGLIGLLIYAGTQLASTF